MKKKSELVVGGEWLPLWKSPRMKMRAPSSPRRFQRRPEALKALAVRGSPQLRAMQRLGRERLDAFIPRLLAQAVEHAN